MAEEDSVFHGLPRNVVDTIFRLNHSQLHIVLVLHCFFGSFWRNALFIS